MFLPLVFLIYWFIVNKSLKLQNIFIVVVSYLFYGWWDWRFLLLIAFTSFCSYYSGVLMCDRDGAAKRTLRFKKIITGSNIVLNLLILGVFKYFNFFTDSLETMLSSLDISLGWVTIDILLPMGISFYTFQAISYTIDIYQKKLQPTHDVVAFFAFVSFFPQLVAGPIERATNLLPQFERTRHFDYGQAVDGCRQILWGFFKKVVIADTCAATVNPIFDDWANMPGSTLWIGAFLFTIQIYCDFSGYSDIAIGTSRLFGISLHQNFNFPYFSRDIAEFWRRWHISLSTWFRDYVYIPLGGSRGTKMLILRNTFVIFALSGLWHGANWTFVVWGLYHAVLFIPLMLLNKNRRNTNTAAAGRMLPSFKELGQISLTFVLVMIGWVIFRAENITEAWGYIGGMFSTSVFTMPTDVFSLKSATALICAFTLFITEWLQRNQKHGLSLEYPSCIALVNKSKSVRYTIYISLLLIITVYMYGGTSQFIYFQF